jgi:TPR repeat protein
MNIDEFQFLLAEANIGKPGSFKNLRKYYDRYGNRSHEIAECAKDEANQGNMAAKWFYGRCCIDQRGITGLIDEGINWVRGAAEDGFPLAQTSIGLWYLYGIPGYGIPGFEKNDKNAITWLGRAAAQGDDIAKKKLFELNTELVRKEQEMAEARATMNEIISSLEKPIDPNKHYNKNRRTVDIAEASGLPPKMGRHGYGKDRFPRSVVL